MFIIISIINIFLWAFASFVIALGMGGESGILLGIIYFVIGYPISIASLFVSEYFSISYFDKFMNPPATIWYRKLAWSNGVGTAVTWGLLFIIGLLVS